MWSSLKRLFPENIFASRIDPSAERRLRLAQARAEESIIRAHVDNALMFVDTLAEDMTFDRAIDSYVRQMSVAPRNGCSTRSSSPARLATTEPRPSHCGALAMPRSASGTTTSPAATTSRR